MYKHYERHYRIRSDRSRIAADALLFLETIVMYSIELLLLCCINVLRTYGAPNSFSIGGRARAPPSFWSAGMQNDNSLSDEPALLNNSVQINPEIAIKKVYVSDMPYSGGNNPEVTNEVPLSKIDALPPSAIESNSKEPPLFNAYPQAEPPTNGFWPDPKAVRDFHKRMKDPTFGSRPENNDAGSRPGTNDLGPRPETVNTQKESAFIHHADNGDYTQPPALVTFPPFTFRIIAEPPPTSTPTPFFPPLAPIATPSPVPIELMVHWIYDVDDRNGNMEPGENSYPGVVIYPQALPLNPPPILCNPGIRFEPAMPCYLEDTFNPPAPIFPTERPPFLLEAPDDIVAEYFKITMDEKLTKGEMKRALEVWKASLPPILLQKYEETEAERERLSLLERDLRAQRVTRLSPLARQVADEIEAIRTNEDFTVMEEEHMIEEILQSIPEDIRQELLAP
ncbi:unnamed protein product [Cylicocyclus nassatus]|uniref:SXP/RAL-2 family protein Ani s 5-like cation-binding domain-containing protein n=1 Tax=Cylicocyclus nassatus TaxID=53992 RepID=A0AA36GKI8_CYLNA|nr:unnamed protein product [Cylicocyclus nassatus]